MVTEDAQDKLYRWVAVLTGSKNTLKGVGFFMGGALLTLLGFKGAIASMASMLFLVWIFSLLLLKKDLGKAKSKPKFNQLFSKSSAINYLSAARLFLFASRDVWFVIALPVFLATQLSWSHWQISSFIALWIIGYGIVQSFAPRITGKKSGKVPDGNTAFIWALILCGTPALIAIAIINNINPELVLVVGLMIFGILFAINSSLHSYLIVSYATDDGVSLDVGFYYMANAMGRLTGTILSGWLFQAFGITICLFVSTLFIAISAMLSLALPKHVH